LNSGTPFSLIFQIGSCAFFIHGWPGPQSSCATCIVGITSMHHHTQLICWNGVSLDFCPDRPWTAIFPISALLVAEITGVHHHIWLSIILNMLFIFCSTLWN
jgi:hypothetical protein